MHISTYLNRNILHRGFTIIEAVISIALFSALSVFIFSVGTPLKLHTNEVMQKLRYYTQIQFVTQYLHQLTKLSQGYEIISDTYDGTKQLHAQVLSLMDPDKTYILFKLKNGLALCGLFTDVPDTLVCFFSYPERMARYALLNINQDQFADTHTQSECKVFENITHRMYSQIKICLPKYHMFVGFLPHIKQVVQ